MIAIGQGIRAKIMINKEKRGILDVTFGDRKATLIYKDVEAIEDAVIEYLAMYVKGYHSNRNDRGFGAEHIADTIRKSKREGDNCHSTPFTNAIITFYSDRNFSQRMEFKNPKVSVNEKQTQQDSNIVENSIESKIRRHK